MPVSVTIDHVIKTFGTFTALKDVSLTVQPGELFFLLGPSGCGKTTLLRSIAGFYTPDAGRILIGERDVTQLPPHRRDTGMMFQSYALWPHLTLAENVAFGLEMRKIPKAEMERRVMEALDRVHLADRAKSRPNQLSGGQQQRVALARALVIEPQCLLLDEPLSNLDAKLRLEMRMDIRRVCKQAGLTAIYVTHDQKEALSIADRLAVMRAGVLEQIGTPAEVYRHPVNTFVAGFIGEGNFIPAVVREVNDRAIVTATPFGPLTATRFPADVKAGGTVTLCIRPETVRLDPPPSACPNRLACLTKSQVYLGEIAQRVLTLQPNDPATDPFDLKVFEINPQQDSSPAGEAITCWVAPEQVIVTHD
ncbi:MAG: ABC transporter ATP-binding protein [Kiritimatiellae bacterium]|nr:ABC transporter ATP-binding protein [Kiritimatiellia bacterium]